MVQWFRHWTFISKVQVLLALISIIGSVRKGTGQINCSFSPEMSHFTCEHVQAFVRWSTWSYKASFIIHFHVLDYELATIS